MYLYVFIYLNIGLTLLQTVWQVSIYYEQSMPHIYTYICIYMYIYVYIYIYLYLYIYISG